MSIEAIPSIMSTTLAVVSHIYQSKTGRYGKLGHVPTIRKTAWSGCILFRLNLNKHITFIHCLEKQQQ